VGQVRKGTLEPNSKPIKRNSMQSPHIPKKFRAKPNT